MNKLLKWIYISRARFYAKKLQPMEVVSFKRYKVPAEEVGKE